MKTMSNRLFVVMVGSLAAVSAVGFGLFSLLHAGVDLGLVDVPTLAPVAAFYGVSAVGFAVVAYGVFGRRSWAKKTATIVFGAALVAMLWRLAIVADHGVSSLPFLASALVFAIGLAVLLSPPRRGGSL